LGELLFLYVSFHFLIFGKQKAPTDIAQANAQTREKKGEIA